MKSIELFSGTGGLALGLQQAGFEHEALFEWDKDSCENIRRNIANGYPGVNDWTVFQSDVRTVSYDGYTGKSSLLPEDLRVSPFPWAVNTRLIMTNGICFPKQYEPSVKHSPRHSF